MGLVGLTTENCAERHNNLLKLHLPPPLTIGGSSNVFRFCSTLWIDDHLQCRLPSKEKSFQLEQTIAKYVGRPMHGGNMMTQFISESFTEGNAPSDKQKYCFLPVLPIQPSHSAASSLQPVVHFHSVSPAAGSPVQKQQVLPFQGPQTNSPTFFCMTSLFLLTDGSGCWQDTA